MAVRFGGGGLNGGWVGAVSAETQVERWGRTCAVARASSSEASMRTVEEEMVAEEMELARYLRGGWAVRGGEPG